MGIGMDQQDIVDELARLAEQNTRLEAEVTRLREERIPHVDKSSRRRDRRLTVAYVLATALVVGLASVGSASALDGSNTVFSDDIVDGTVTSLDVKNNAIITSDVKDGSIASRDIADESIGNSDISDGTIGSADIANLSVGSADIGDSAVDGYHIADGSVSTNEVANGSVGGIDIADGSIKGEDLNLFNDNQCTGETVQGTAFIDVEENMPYTYTTSGVYYGHSCSGEPVRVKFKSGNTVLLVSFGASNPARLAMVTSRVGIYQMSAEAEGPGEFRVSVTPLCNCGTGIVGDFDFSILAY